MSEVEMTYQAPKGNLRSKIYLNEQLGHQDLYHDLKDKALFLGFRGDGYHRNHRGVWEVFGRSGSIGVPNFPEGETRYEAGLGLYYLDRDERFARQVVMQVSSHSVLRGEFRENLDNIAKYYLERPQFLGFPSRFSRPNSGNTFKAATLLTVVGIGVSYGVLSPDLIPTVAESLMVGATSGAWAGLVGHRVFGSLGEVYAASKIQNKSQILAGPQADAALRSEHEHTLTVQIQREIFRQLKKDHPDLPPDVFLRQVYRQLPDSLTYRRKEELVKEQAEIEQVLPRSQSSALPDLIEISRILSKRFRGVLV